ncbi:MAG: hypothetical protein II559_01840 [Muribaculaceae bacterium]|nr:hypothetical protein [Muribaculaceae bacterium]MBQ2562145.1 hypothetical protein [Muribaculaceae bacterium]MBQ5408379.1 hypothetical protein [Muribaculaceae bacterium]MDY6293023.1 hypothetical protein [Bacteroidales bacterium]
MANKRQLKKAIRYACGEMAGECFFAQEAFEGTNPEDWDRIVLNIALLQAEAVNRVSVDFDKIPKDFENGKEYNKARRAYFKAVEKGLSSYLKEESEKIVADMNALIKK